jgi:LL-diaminopimelate aminotransferase
MYAKRIDSLPKYLFAELDELKHHAIKRGKDIIDLGIGDPDQPTPEHIIKALQEAATDRETHGYPPYEGILPLREAIARWYRRRKGVMVSEDEVLVLIGSKEGIAHAPFAFLNEGDLALVPDPSYPVYRNSVILSGGNPVMVPLREKWLPRLDEMKREARRAVLLWLNYPNNPTSAVAPVDFFQNVIDFARENEIIILHDHAYGEITYDGYIAPSILSVEGAMEVAVEFHSFSKTYNMTGWRIGFAVGNREILQGILKIKMNIDSGAWSAIQRAAIAALDGPQECIKETISIYRERRNILSRGMEALGLEFSLPKATFYLWVKIPSGFSSIQYSKLLLEKTGVVAAPGVGFGSYGEGYLRFSFTQPTERIKEAVERMEGMK